MPEVKVVDEAERKRRVWLEFQHKKKVAQDSHLEALLCHEAAKYPTLAVLALLVGGRLTFKTEDIANFDPKMYTLSVGVIDGEAMITCKRKPPSE